VKSPLPLHRCANRHEPTILALQRTGQQGRAALATGRGEQLPAETNGLPESAVTGAHLTFVSVPSSPGKHAQLQKTEAIFEQAVLCRPPYGFCSPSPTNICRMAPSLSRNREAKQFNGRCWKMRLHISDELTETPHTPAHPGRMCSHEDSLIKLELCPSPWWDRPISPKGKLS